MKFNDLLFFFGISGARIKMQKYLIGNMMEECFQIFKTCQEKFRSFRKDKIAIV